MDDYDIPFDGMSEDEFMYRAMDDSDPMYMGGPVRIGDDVSWSDYYDEYDSCSFFGLFD